MSTLHYAKKRPLLARSAEDWREGTLCGAELADGDETTVCFAFVTCADCRKVYPASNHPPRTIVLAAHGETYIAGIRACELKSTMLFDATKAGFPARKLSNLGWILRHRADVEDFSVSVRLAAGGSLPNGYDAVLCARMGDGRVYACPFASASVLADWLDRPSFQGMTVSWECRQWVIGSRDYREEIRR